jgi:hypothetical protein
MKSTLASAVYVIVFVGTVLRTAEAEPTLYVDEVPILSCGETKVAMKFEHLANLGYAEAVVTVSKRKQTTAVRVSDARDYVSLKCEVGVKGQRFVVIQGYCGGSGCHDLDNFYIVSTDSLNVLLTPRNRDDMNRQDAARILGHVPVFNGPVYSIQIGPGGRER